MVQCNDTNTGKKYIVVEVQQMCCCIMLDISAVYCLKVKSAFNSNATFATNFKIIFLKFRDISQKEDLLEVFFFPFNIFNIMYDLPVKEKVHSNSRFFGRSIRN